MPELPDQVFHIADALNWEAIQREGLLSTSALIDRAGVDASVRSVLSAYRPDGIAALGVGYVRDQAPMPPAALARCLDDGLTPDDWYELINSHVFFWADPDRLARHLRALRARPQVVLTLDGPRLAEAYSGQAFVTPFNVGAARRQPARRGRRTFVPLAAWRDNGWASEAPTGRPARRAQHPPAELVIRGAVPDILSFVTATHHEPGTN
jgi:hypothetical protein